MRQPSIVIHRGKKEEKYELYVEDYVISFLKEKTDGKAASELNFYGSREGRKYVIYGAGQDRHLAVFDRYELLEEVGCRMEQTEPVFLIREGSSTYEVKGYKVFYHENEEMQDYLIDQEREEHKRSSSRNVYKTAGNINHRDKRAGSGFQGMRGHYAASLQVGIVFVILVAIVINSANSYEKMEQLNRSAAEVFFVMENQEADETAAAGEKEHGQGTENLLVERDSRQGDPVLQDGPFQDTILQDNVLQENALQGQSGEQAEIAEQAETAEQTGTAGRTGQAEDEDARTARGESDPEERPEGADAEMAPEETGLTGQTEDGSRIPQEAGNREAASEGQSRAEEDGDLPQAEKSDEEEAGAEEGIEALSRSVTRYYEVERGDTLYLISKKIYGDTAHVKKICEINQIADPDNIRCGQKIILP